MARMREPHWVPRLRRLTKRVIKQSYGCHRFQVRAAAKPPLALRTIVRPDTFDNSGTAKPEVGEFRPTRDAAMTARVRMQDIADKEQAN